MLLTQINMSRPSFPRAFRLCRAHVGPYQEDLSTLTSIAYIQRRLSYHSACHHPSIDPLCAIDGKIRDPALACARVSL